MDQGETGEQGRGRFLLVREERIVHRTETGNYSLFRAQTVLALRVGGLVWLQACWTFNKREETIFKLPQILSTPSGMTENEQKLREPPLGP